MMRTCRLGLRYSPGQVFHVANPMTTSGRSWILAFIDEDGAVRSAITYDVLYPDHLFLEDADSVYCRDTDHVMQVRLLRARVKAARERAEMEERGD